jgi:hypothetical protein
MGEIKFKLASTRLLSEIEAGEKKINELLDSIGLGPTVDNRRSFRISMSILAIVGLAVASITVILICCCGGCCPKRLTSKHRLLKPRWPQTEAQILTNSDPNGTSKVTLAIPNLSTLYTQFNFEQFQEWVIQGMQNQLNARGPPVLQDLFI